jgi:hypothetical protein
MSGASPRSSEGAADLARADYGDPHQLLLPVVAIF